MQKPLPVINSGNVTMGYKLNSVAVNGDVFESGNSKPNVGPVLNVNAGRPSIAVSPSDPTVR